MTEEEVMKKWKIKGGNGGRRNVLAGQFITVRERKKEGQKKRQRIFI